MVLLKVKHILYDQHPTHRIANDSVTPIPIIMTGNPGYNGGRVTYQNKIFDLILPTFIMAVLGYIGLKHFFRIFRTLS